MPRKLREEGKPNQNIQERECRLRNKNVSNHRSYKDGTTYITVPSLLLLNLQFLSIISCLGFPSKLPWHYKRTHSSNPEIVNSQRRNVRRPTMYKLITSQRPLSSM